MNITGCTKFMADQTAGLMIESAPVVEMEEDPIIAEAATLSGLKTIEGMLYLSPKNEKLLMTVTQSFAGYGAAFLEPDWALREDYFSEEYLAIQRRLIGLYRRSRDTGLRWIEQRNAEVAELLRAPSKDTWAEALPEALARMKKRDVPALFWTAQAWAMLIRVDEENFIEIANMPKVEMMMQRVFELDPDYNFGAVHLYFGMMGAMLGEELGGDLDEAKRHFENAIAVTDGRYLTARYFYAREYCRAIQDRECFVNGLEEIADADPNIFPEQRLANTLATIWARKWLDKADELF